MRAVMTAHIRYPAVARSRRRRAPSWSGCSARSWVSRARDDRRAGDAGDRGDRRARGRRRAGRSLPGRTRSASGRSGTPAEVAAALRRCHRGRRYASGRLAEEAVGRGGPAGLRERRPGLRLRYPDTTSRPEPKPRAERVRSRGRSVRSSEAPSWSSSGRSRRSPPARPTMGWGSCSARRRSGSVGGSLPLLDSERQLVVILRDAHRHPWQRELVSPGSVVVETGLPEWRPRAREPRGDARRRPCEPAGCGRAPRRRVSSGFSNVRPWVAHRARLGRHRHRAGHARLVLQAVRRPGGFRSRGGRRSGRR